MLLPSILAMAPTAVSQSPSKILRNCLSAITQILVNLWLIFSNNSIISESFFLHCKATTPCPTLGMISFVENIWDIFWSNFKDWIPA